MRLIKIGSSTLDTTVGAFVSNTDKVIAASLEMAAQQCTIGAFPEMVISGYPVEDLVQWKGFLSGQWKQLIRFARETSALEQTTFTVGLAVGHKGKVYNVLAMVYRGKILGLVPKMKMPTYNVFDEGRTMSPWPYGVIDRFEGDPSIPIGDMVFQFPFGTVAPEVCEDIWSHVGPAEHRVRQTGAEIVINASASPFRFGVVETRHEMLATRSADNQALYLYTNKYGGQDGLAFDGGTLIYQNGRKIVNTPRWEDSITCHVVDLDTTYTRRLENTTWRNDVDTFSASDAAVHLVSVPDGPKPDDSLRVEPPRNKSFFIPALESVTSKQKLFFDDAIAAMITGLEGYVEKTGAFKRIAISLSGGSDSIISTIAAYLYAKKRFVHLSENEQRAAIKDFIHCYSFPTKYNSAETQEISRVLCEELGLTFIEIPIQDEFDAQVAKLELSLGLDELDDITTQNIQARIRGAYMNNITNAIGGLFLQTGNMTEKALGYFTIGGDGEGGFGLINNMPKTVVLAILDYLKAEGYAPQAIKLLQKTKPSAELKANQADENELGPFEVLDACSSLFAGEKMMPAEVYVRVRGMFTNDELRELYPAYELGMLKKWVKGFFTKFVQSIYKWVQSPLAVHLGSLDYDRERALRLTVAQSKEWLELEKIDSLPD